MKREKPMSAQLIDGKTIARQVRDDVAAEVAKRIAAGKPRPGLATVLVGDRVDSATYVSAKQKACKNWAWFRTTTPCPPTLPSLNWKGSSAT
jgi:methylenetetrahydrofolate dehydrogenase (NADP+) / methenyltetrahydrofolate cyclohydrolase